MSRYAKFIQSRKSRIIPEGVPTQMHHIIPKSLGGTDVELNKIELTDKEHFVAHHLLAVEIPCSETSFAFWRMCNPDGTRTYNGTARTYAKARENHRRLLSERNVGEGNPRWGKKDSVETIEKKRLSHLGKKYTYKTDDGRHPMHNVTGSDHYNYGKKRSEEQKKQMSVRMSGENNPMYGKVRKGEKHPNQSIAMSGENNPMFGKTHTDESRQKISEKSKGKHWYTDGNINIRAYECPDGFHPGRIINK